MVTDYRLKILIFALVALGGCATPASPCTPRTELRVAYADLRLDSSDQASPASVGALAFAPDGKTLTVAYAFEATDTPGRLVRLTVDELAVQDQVKLGSLAVRLTRLSHDVNRVASVVQVSCRNDVTLHEPCWQVNVWETATGNLLSVPHYPFDDVWDMSLAGDGKWLYVATNSNHLYDPTRDFGGSGLMLFRETGLRHFVAVTISEDARIIAYGIKDIDLATGDVSGAVGVRAWDGAEITDIPIVRFGDTNVVWVGEDTSPRIPLRVAIAPSKQWIAIQSASAVELWQFASLLNTKRGPVALPQASSGVVAFNPSSDLVAVGHSQGLTVLSVPDLNVLADNRDANVTSAAFSPDGCMLAWGDMNGVVHLSESPHR